MTFSYSITRVSLQVPRQWQGPSRLPCEVQLEIPYTGKDTNWLSITEASIKANVTKETLTELNAKLILVRHVLKFPLLKQQQQQKTAGKGEKVVGANMLVPVVPAGSFPVMGLDICSCSPDPHFFQFQQESHERLANALLQYIPGNTDLILVDSRLLRFTSMLKPLASLTVWENSCINLNQCTPKPHSLNKQHIQGEHAPHSIRSSPFQMLIWMDAIHPLEASAFEFKGVGLTYTYKTKDPKGTKQECAAVGSEAPDSI
ncbi:hypothetical protein Anapl_03262 [Anas platyrhynchos]|uniref:Uncharacterized protein n=1 Tax=Anas platyrhynchos TaxID=8839 RepID=R0LSR4_ANAPL|nr:hypothetical protein Anapl_03262 [Anas platyrhynchos]